MTIRPYQTKDYRYVEDICMKTSWLADEDTPTNRAMLCSLYCHYYVENQSQTCFVAVDDNDVPVGYVLCAPDADDYAEQMENNYLPLVRKLSSSEYYKAVAEQKIAKRYISDGFTAHLHIDILPQYQRQGLGTQLIDALTEKLTQMCVEGVRLVCAIKNDVARKFYEKMGFDDIDYHVGAVVYGKKLFAEEE